VKRSNRLVILIGLLLAALAFVGIVIVLNQSAATPQAEAPTETVLVATEAIAIGDPVTADVVEEQQVAIGAAVRTPLRAESQVQGQPALFAIPAGSQVTQEAIGLGIGAQNIAQQLGEGERAIGFVIDRVQGVDFLVQPGDSVDVVTSINVAGDGSTGLVRTVKTILQNKRVLYVSNSRLQAAPAASPAAGDGGAPAPAAEFATIVIVIAGTDQDAEVIRFAQRTATEIGDQVPSALSLTLRAPGDETIEETTGITIDQLIEDYGVPIPDMTDLEELQAGDESQPEPAP
jgi:Flp pilus assembly protein CpaB